ncbi:D-alanine--D-alanine ligase [bacterium]|nr:D-alanine--D-alanine ligase [bacterium]
MKIGIAYDLRPEDATDGRPDDFFEEYDSTKTVDAIAAALEALGHEVQHLGGGLTFLDHLRTAPPDLVWNIAEGRGGRCRESHIPAICEFLNVPYTHSDPLTLAATLDKAVAKRLVSAAGVQTPDFAVVRSPDDIGRIKFPPPPLFVKPLDEGSSKGIRNNPVCRRIMEAEERARWLLETYRRPVLVEAFIPGREITVGVVGSEVLGVLEVLPKSGNNPEFIYSLEVKRDFERQVDYVTPPSAPSAILQKIEESALLAFHALECRDVARIDFRLTESGTPYFLEANPLPGLSPSTGDLPILARLLGLSYADLISRILSASLARLNLSVPAPV